MLYGGPKEAVMHGIYRQNHGFTDIVIGRKHADAPFDDGKPIWGDFDAQEIFDNLNGELHIRPCKIGFAAYFDERRPRRPDGATTRTRSRSSSPAPRCASRSPAASAPTRASCARRSPTS